jgi:hypothetical protein
MMVVSGLLAVANGFAWWLRLAPGRRKKSIVFLYCRCSQCKRRLRYPAQAMLQKVLCPTCKRELVLPPSPGAPAR